MSFYILFDICDKSAWSKRLTQFFPGISHYSCLFHLHGKFRGESFQSQWRLISELIQLLQLLSVINIVQLKQWIRLSCWILNFALSLGIFFVPPDCFLVRSGLVSDLTNGLLMKKIICSLGSNSRMKNFKKIINTLGNKWHCYHFGKGCIEQKREKKEKKNENNKLLINLVP